MQGCSETIQDYFGKLNTNIRRIYDVAKKAREIGIDPTEFPEIHPASDLASRVEALTGPPGIAVRIRELNAKMDSEETAFKIAEEIINGKFDLNEQDHKDEKVFVDRFDPIEKNKIAELATRAALSILTGGITAAPIEGISSVKIRENFDRTEYLAIYFAGPIRSAGGTEAALAVLVCDWVRTLLKLDKYKPIKKEVERYIEEIQAYKREVNLQYPSTQEEIRNAAMNIPIEITGEPTENVEVTGNRDLKRVETNQLRGGACLVLNDGIIGKAHKLTKIVKKLNILGWNWIERLQSKKTSGENDDEKIPPKEKYIAKVITGRPVFAYPSKIGGFRVRYGRSRNTGFAAIGLNPATMILLDNFLVPGTQFITERPGKGAIVLPVTSIEGPIVRLKGGKVQQINSVKEAIKHRDEVEKLIFLGDCLIAFGEFLENNHLLIPSGYCEEWWCEELKNIIEKKYGNLNDASKDLSISIDLLKKFLDDPFYCKPNDDQTLMLSTKLQIPIHPKFNYFWGNISEREFVLFRNWLKTKKLADEPSSLELDYDANIKNIIEKLGIPHSLEQNRIIFTDQAKIIRALTSLDSDSFEFIRPTKENLWKGFISSFSIRDRAPYYIGARMGRPEKAKGREFFHILFPVGIEGGNRRSIIKAAEAKKVSVEIVYRECPKCGKNTYLNKCSKCNIRTKPIQKCSQLNCQTKSDDEYCPRCGNVTRFYDQREIPIRKLLSRKLKELNEPLPKEIKGVKGLMSKKKVPEILEKGILRAKHNLFAYRDGTIRFDATDAPLTHFTPSEIDVSIEKLQNLGYQFDYLGNPLQTKDQILELRLQDVVIPVAGAEFLIRVAKFIDELLVKVYKLEPFYNISKKEDLLGHIIIGLAPHISAGIVGRIIGFTTAKLCYAHPYWHSAKRRNCDGDEDTIILGLDALLNFSRSYLPQKKGGMMDAPLVLTSELNPSEIDDEVYNMEVEKKFSGEFYEKTLEYIHPKKIQEIIDIVEHRIGRLEQFEGLFFTHPTDNINDGPKNSKYKQLKTVKQKVQAQLALAAKTDAADARDEARRLLNTHFIPDIIGNLRSFSTQQFRCIKCNIKFRRLPLFKQCNQCGGKIIPTVTERGIKKYLGLSLEIVKKYDLDTYTKQRLLLSQDFLDSIFTSDKVRQLKLDKF